jgi:hypothetical protein
MTSRAPSAIALVRMGSWNDVDRGSTSVPFGINRIKKAKSSVASLHFSL